MALFQEFQKCSTNVPPCKSCWTAFVPKVDPKLDFQNGRPATVEDQFCGFVELRSLSRSQKGGGQRDSSLSLVGKISDKSCSTVPAKLLPLLSWSTSYLLFKKHNFFATFSSCSKLFHLVPRSFRRDAMLNFCSHSFVCAVGSN